MTREYKVSLLLDEYADRREKLRDKFTPESVEGETQKEILERTMQRIQEEGELNKEFVVKIGILYIKEDPR